MSDIDPQAGAEQLDEDELPQDTIPEKFIDPEDWDRGAGADESRPLAHDEYGGDDDDIALELETDAPAEEQAMHVERGISEDE